MTESRYTAKLKKLLEAEGALVIKYRPGNGQRVGVPDIYIAHPDFQGWIEVKYKKNPLRPVQRSVITMLAARMIPVFILRGPEGSLEDVDGHCFHTLDHTQPLIPQLVAQVLC